ncbi:hypothetical protein PInf_017800 [Phytophthora infestans]|nr:hypothetical protein PInf_017800 [Phytophthora infestans]
MSFCIDSELANSTTTFDHCFFYKFGSGYEDLKAINETAGDVSEAERLAYATVLATAAGMDATQFDKFLDKSCSILGMGTMTFGGMSAITCRQGDKKWVGGGFFLAGVAAFTAMLTFVLWLVQAGPLGEKDDTSLKTAFFLMIIAMLHCDVHVLEALAIGDGKGKLGGLEEKH